MTTKHTPGPWWVDGSDQQGAVVAFNRNGDYALIRCADPTLEDSYASLIAAAPDLLAALRECAEYLAEFGPKADHLNLVKPKHVACGKVRHNIAAAIAKAEGRP